MTSVRVHSFSISLDGFAAGPDQDLDHPLGVGGEQLHNWAFATRTFSPDGATGVDDDFARRGEVNIGATIMGRNMFGPMRGHWGDVEWRGWWGADPPFHHPVFVLTNHARDPIEMEGGTTFHFVTDGTEAALARAIEAAGEHDVRIAGGAATIRQYVLAGLVDELHLAIVPALLGDGERLFDGLGPVTERYRVSEFVGTIAALHVRLVRTDPQIPEGA